jgi:riboflavin synthase alpha subunit
MSKIFRRPMFRRGGEVGGGIMTGHVDKTMKLVELQENV